MLITFSSVCEDDNGGGVCANGCMHAFVYGHLYAHSHLWIYGVSFSRLRSTVSGELPVWPDLLAGPRAAQRPGDPCVGGRGTSGHALPKPAGPRRWAMEPSQFSTEIQMNQPNGSPSSALSKIELDWVAVVPATRRCRCFNVSVGKKQLISAVRALPLDVCVDGGFIPCVLITQSTT